jgi:hypothetical protein
MGNPVVHWEITGRDAGKLHAFYRELFDWKINADNPINYGLVDTGGGGINGGIDESKDRTRVTFYVQVDDLKKVLDKVEALGGKTLVPPTEIPNMVTFALFSDPDGNVIGLVKE